MTMEIRIEAEKSAHIWKNNFKLAESILSIKCKTIIEKQNFLGGLGGGVL